MKIHAFILALLLLTGMTSCKKNQNQTVLEGTWELHEQLMDPGDGSGTFQPASGKEITFHSNGTFTANFSLCGMGSSGNPTDGTVDQSGAVLIPQNCASGVTVGYKLENGNLYLFYPCIEACQEKYKKSAQ